MTRHAARPAERSAQAARARVSRDLPDSLAQGTGDAVHVNFALVENVFAKVRARRGTARRHGGSDGAGTWRLYSRAAT